MCRSVADNLKAGARLKPDMFLESSVYFSDIDDFSSFVSELSPLQIVDLLGRLWIMFDDVIAKHNVYKVSVQCVCVCVCVSGQCRI